MSPDYRDGIDWGWQDQSRQANPGDATNDYAKYEEFLASRPVVHPAALDPMPLCPKCGKAVTLWTDLNHAARADCDACGYSTFDATRDI